MTSADSDSDAVSARRPLNLALRDEVLANLVSFERRSHALDEGMRHAAVALVLVADEAGDACFLITRRASRMRDHAGQWALPGGRLIVTGVATAPGSMATLPDFLISLAEGLDFQGIRWAPEIEPPEFSATFLVRQ